MADKTQYSKQSSSVNDNLQDELFLKNQDVIKTFRDGPYSRNEVLYNHIYFESKLSINKLAKKLGCSRQFVWGILNRRLLVSFSMARKICDILGVKEIQTLFRQDDIYYPNFKTALEVMNDDKTTTNSN